MSDHPEKPLNPERIEAPVSGRKSSEPSTAREDGMRQDGSLTSNQESIWQCKIGGEHTGVLPPGCDLPMRKAIAAAFREITGAEPQFIFSGWASKLTESERAVVENRDPDYDKVVGEVRGQLERLTGSSVPEMETDLEIYDATGHFPTCEVGEGTQRGPCDCSVRATAEKLMQYCEPRLTPEQLQKFASEHVNHGVVYVCYHQGEATVLSFEDVRLESAVETSAFAVKPELQEKHVENCHCSDRAGFDPRCLHLRYADSKSCSHARVDRSGCLGQTCPDCGALV